MAIIIGEGDYCEENDAKLAAIGNVVLATTGERLFLRGPLAAMQRILANLGVFPVSAHEFVRVSIQDDEERHS